MSLADSIYWSPAMSRNDRKRGSVEEYLSLAEAAGRMGISERTARRWIKSGKLRAYKPGRDYWIPESALRELVEESEVHPKAERRSSLEPSFNDVLENERREAVYRYAGEKGVTLEQLHELGIKSNNDDVVVLNHYLGAHDRYAIQPGDWPVDHERVKGILAFLLAIEGMLSEEEREAAHGALYSELVEANG